MMKNYEESEEINNNPYWPDIQYHTYRILIISHAGSGKTNVLLNLIKLKTTYWQNLFVCQTSSPIKASVTYKWKGKVGIEQLRNSKTCIDYSQTFDDVYENLENYNPPIKIKVLIMFDDMIAGMEAIKNYVV